MPISQIDNNQNGAEQINFPYKVKFTESDIVDLSLFITIALIQKYPSREQWKHPEAFEFAMDIYSITMSGIHSDSDKEELIEVESDIEQCSWRINHGHSHCTCGNHSGYREVFQ